MNLRKAFLSLILIMCVCMLPVVEAATPSSFTLAKEGTSLNYDQSIVSGGGLFTPIYFPIKYIQASNRLVFCSGDRSANADPITFSKTSFTNANDGAAAAAVINAGVGENALRTYDKEKIFITQLALWKVLPNTGSGFGKTEGALSASQKTLFNNLISKGNAARTTYNEISNFAITLSASSLNFTLKGSTYVSQEITVSGKQVKSVTASVNKGTVEKTSTGTYVVKVPKSKLALGKNTITVTFNAKSNSILVAANYSNGRSDQQTVTPTEFDTYDNTASKSISGTITLTTKVTINKVNDKNEKIAGAKLLLQCDDTNCKSFQDTEWTTEAGKSKVFNNLPFGKYKLTETQAPNGYRKNNESKTFTLSATTTEVTVNFENDLEHITRIRKVDANGNRIANASLVLKKGTTVIRNWKSSASKDEEFTDLAAGTYTLEETAAPSGYIVAESVTITVDADGNANPSTIKMINYKIPTITIAKVDAETGGKLAGAKFVIKDKNKQNIVVSEWTSSKSSAKSIQLEPGTYYLIETAAPSGYIINSEAAAGIKITVSKQGKISPSSISVKDYKKGTASIVKIDADSKENLAGAKFVIKDSTKTNVVDSWTSDTKAHTVTLEPGTYYLFETEAPKNYVISDEAAAGIKITVDNKGKVSPSSITVSNSLNGKIIVSKVDADTGTKIAGAVLVLKFPDGTQKEWTTEAGKDKTFTNLKAGKYILTEKSAPNGYIRNKKSIEIVLDNNKTVSKTVKMENSLEGEVLISKVDATTSEEIAGATLVLTYPDGKTTTWKSTGEPKVFKNLPAGAYKLTETIAPNGYILNKSEITFVVDSDGTVEEPVVMKNYPQGKITISKADITTGEELPGATLIVEDSKGKVVDKWVSTGEPHVIKNLNPGTYTLKEVIAPKGYVLSSETIEFVVNNDGTTDGNIVMKNEPEDVVVNPKTGSALIIGLIIAFIAFPISFYYFADYRYKKNM